MIWKSVGDLETRKYDFTYDVSSRLTGADFNQLTGGTFNKTGGMDFSVSGLTYDINGNILTMTQKGWKLNASSIIDNLTYQYNTNSNQLVKVTDAVSDPNTKLGDFKDGANSNNDYNYDSNGNLSSDQNKGITSILYTHLNMPYEVNIAGKGKITYAYDNFGRKLKKIVIDSTTTTPTTTTWIYQNNCVYKNDTLQFFTHEEGRARFDTADAAQEMTKFDFDYFLKDHLGNVRMVLTEEKDTAMYPSATIEDARRPSEQNYYDIKTAQVRAKNTITGATGIASFENNLYKVHGGLAGQKTGLGITLKVMAGDRVGIRVESYYNLGSGPGANSSIPFTELLAAFTGSTPLSGKGITPTDVSNIGGNTSLLNNFLNTSSTSTVANAHLCWVLFDDQFRFLTSGVDQVQNNGGYKNHTQFITNPVSVSKNGYIYVFVSNKSNLEVFFDNLAVTHYKSPILEETHYYPFGLTMAGISSRAIGKAENRFKYSGKELQSKEFTDGSGLELYDFGARQHDPQIGRWTTIDPLVQKRFWATPYNYVQNNPLNRIDPNGLTDYTLDKKTGEVKQVGEKNNDPDRILKTNRKGEVKYKRNGEAKVALGGIEKGILKDGINFQKNDNVIAVGGKGQPSVDGVKSFTLNLSEYIGKEIKGYSYSSDGSGNVTDIVLGKYVNNELMKSRGTTEELRNKYGDKFALANIVQEFHTHPNGELGATESAPHLSDDVKGLRRDKPFLSNARFIILYRSAGHTKPAEYDYTHEYVP